MTHKLIATLTLATTSNKTFHIGPWIIVPILLIAVVIGTAIYIVRDRRKRRLR